MIALTVAAAIALQSDVPWFPDRFSMLCQSRGVVGFHWTGSEYRQTTFEDVQRVITVKPGIDCFLTAEEMQPTAIGSIAVKKICASERLLGQPVEEYGTDCDESHVRVHDEWVSQLTCEQGVRVARYALNGRYFYSDVSGMLAAEDAAEHRDLFVENGHCSVVD